MNKFLTFLRRCHIFHKRFYLKKGFIALLLMIPIIGLALRLTSRLDSGIMTVALVSEDGDPAAVEIMRGIKKAFDPNNILNPRKVCFD